MQLKHILESDFQENFINKMAFRKSIPTIFYLNVNFFSPKTCFLFEEGSDCGHSLEKNIKHKCEMQFLMCYFVRTFYLESFRVDLAKR
jgi:hypothetical protein